MSEHLEDDERKRAVADLFAWFAAAYPQLKFAQETLEVWCKLLWDLPPWAIRAAAVKILAEQEVPGLPGLGRVRKVAEELAGLRLPASKAWALARDTKRWIINPRGYLVGLEDVPPEVEEAAKRFGLEALENSAGDGASFDRFRRIYEEVLSEQLGAKVLRAFPPAKTETETEAEAKLRHGLEPRLPSSESEQKKSKRRKRKPKGEDQGGQEARDGESGRIGNEGKESSLPQGRRGEDGALS